MRSGKPKPLARLGTGVFMLLVFQVLSAPVWAGCGHPVTSRTDRSRLPSLIDPLIDDLGGRTDPIQAPPRPCTGAWCSGQPGTPAVPAGTYDLVMQPWALWNLDAVLFPASSSFTSLESCLLHSLHGVIAVFHPPRSLRAV
jgi:hypothetical protein